eukprot:CAMPEP_0202895886 /NCGR_PEP_ID=MMETSP1392-20130828/4999_1 /ASSEMBLY_ACC=CAM_ASM_000868 /TAXON_ID=225041 /ORGANISM="Chlamydomonas chlamydogama, Strain SAG 11-48b" /LENGTH=80 /DNA_ID=CAMNT_0049581053 /DNA_START=101 /DNA_END=340 /DNA_ORIENTATION=+
MAAPAAWTIRLNGLVGLSDREKGQALVILVTKSDEYQQAVFSGSDQVTVAAMRALLRDAEPNNSVAEMTVCRPAPIISPD